jgi:hypothetical protein
MPKTPNDDRRPAELENHGRYVVYQCEPNKPDTAVFQTADRVRAIAEAAHLTYRALGSAYRFRVFDRDADDYLTE